MAMTFRTDVHLYPLYLKWASYYFHENNTSEGLRFFNLACDCPKELVQIVYRKLWKIQGQPQGDPEYGEKAFHGLSDLSSTALEKAQAIDRFLRKVDRNELERRENLVHKSLEGLHRDTFSDLGYGRHAFYNTHEKFSNFEDKIAAIQKYSIESRPFTWVTNNEIVHLIKRGDDELETLTVDERSQKSTTSSFDRRGYSMEESISLLKEFDVAVNGGRVILSKLLVPTDFDWRFPLEGGKEVRLRLKQSFQGNTSTKTLVWHFFDNLKSRASCVNVSDNDLPIISVLDKK